MMRDILFRGKRIANDEWVEGYLYITHDGECEIGRYNPNVDIERWTCVVDPDTVGQYTGLEDKNGKKIFEGDIVRYNTFSDFDCYSVVKFGEYEQDGSGGEYSPRDCIGWYVEVDNFTCPDWADNDPIYFSDYLNQQNLYEVSDECEVIGNIHDNPELLGGVN